jgi:hypothetical protein
VKLTGESLDFVNATSEHSRMEFFEVPQHLDHVKSGSLAAKF